MSNRDDALTIRLARPEERRQLEDLQRRASIALDDYREQLLAHLDAIDLPRAQLANGQVIVAEVEGAIAGFAAVVGGELDGLFVEPDLWRRGVGAALVHEAAHQARIRGLSLTVIASPTARGFYEKCGLSVEGEAQTRFGPAITMSK